MNFFVKIHTHKGGFRAVLSIKAGKIQCALMAPDFATLMDMLIFKAAKQRVFDRHGLPSPCQRTDVQVHIGYVPSQDGKSMEPCPEPGCVAYAKKVEEEKIGLVFETQDMDIVPDEFKSYFTTPDGQS